MQARRYLVFPLAVGLAAMFAPWAQAQSHDSAHAAHHAAEAAPEDSGFAALQERGARAMGVDQYTSTHRFQPLPDGGRIELTRDSHDSTGTETIRAHLREIALAFACGDFTTPGMVHANAAVPGTAIMNQRRGAIRYQFNPLPGGGEVRISTADSAAVVAIHEFLAFQRKEHRAGE